MSNKISSHLIDVWLSKITKREAYIIAVNLGCFLFFLLALNPTTQVLWEVWALDASQRPITAFEFGVIYSVLAVGLLIITVLLGAIVSHFLDVEGDKYQEFGFLRKLELNYKFLPAKDILALDSTFITKTILNKKVIYEIAETKEYVEGSFVIGANTRFRLIAFFFTMLLADSLFGWLLGTYSFLVILLHTALITGLLFLIEIAFGLLYKKKNKKKLLDVIAKTSDIKNHPWCEYQINIKPYILSHSKIAWQSEESLAIEKLNKKLEGKNPEIVKTVIALRLLIDNTYAALIAINDNKVKIVTQKDEDRYANDSQKLKNIINGYAPTCIGKIQENVDAVQGLGIFDATNEGAIASASSIDSQILRAYSELYSDILAQDELVKSIYSYYVNIIQNTAVVDFKSVIDRQARGWNAGEDETYSIKTSVMNESINKNIIPRLESLMIGASEEDVINIKNKIAEFKLFFKEQVAMDKEQALPQQITHDASNDINSVGISIPTRSAIEQELRDADFYLKQLKKRW